MTRIEEIGSTPRLSRLEALVTEMEQMIPMISPNVTQQLRDCVTGLPPQLSPEERLQAWKLSYSIWNSCVDIANNLPPGQAVDDEHAKLRQVACDLLFLAGELGCVDSSGLKIATFFYRTGLIWHRLKSFAPAAVCFEKATELLSKVYEPQERKGAPKTTEDREFLFSVFVARSQTTWELSQRALATSLLARARGLLDALAQRWCYKQLAEVYYEYGKCLLKKEGDAESQIDAIKHLEQAFEICDAAMRCESKETDAGHDVIKGLQMKILRHLAAGHLLKDNYESVLKCVSVLKSGPEHPSTSYLAVKALAGLGRYDEAEKELFVLVRQKAATIDACMSGIEILLQDTDRLEGAKRAYLILQSRHAANKTLPVRMLEHLLMRLPDQQRCRAKIVEAVLDIASNEDVVAAVTGVRQGEMLWMQDGRSDGKSPRKERDCIHALLWNSGSEHFHAREYETCIKLFETAMLYLPRDSDVGNLPRAKCLRVLCLCRLALLQYDRADEYVKEAQKIDPNIASAFLKFRIYLQAKDEDAAAEQVEMMLQCADFDPDYLGLASHEAMNCKLVGIAICALSKFLSLPREHRTASVPSDVVVIRNIVQLALQDPPNPTEALKYLKEAISRLEDAESATFFGEGELASQEANWFASTSWNQGLLSVNTQDWQLAGDFFSCASEFFGCLPETEEILRYLQKSLLLAATCLLASQPGDKCLRSAWRLVDKCRKVHKALALVIDPADMCADSEIHMNLIAFDLKSRCKDHKAQLEILCHCSGLPGFEANYFLLMANQAAKEGGRESLEVACVAYRSALKLALNSTSSDYTLPAMIVRKLITTADQRCRDGPDVIAAYQQAKEVLAGLSQGEYPHEELQWLVATAWNRAGLHVKFLRLSDAATWMEVAIGLTNFDPEMKNRKSSMIDNLNQVRKQMSSTVRTHTPN